MNICDLLSSQKFCISLARSGDRRARVAQEFARVELDVKFVEGVDPNVTPMPAGCLKTPGAWGCAAAHAKLLAIVAASEAEGAMVFEDDVIFCDDFRERMAYLYGLSDIDADGFLIGGHFGQAPPVTWAASATRWRHIYRVHAAGGTYAYAFSAEVARFVTDNWTHRWGADEFFSEVIYRRFCVLAMSPFMCGSVPGLSLVTGTRSEYANVGWYYQQGTFDLSGLPFSGVS